MSYIASRTGIPERRLEHLETGTVQPSGDEVLVLAEFYHRDFGFLIADQPEDPEDNVQSLLRSEGKELNDDDRSAIREFVFLCRMQAFLESLLSRLPQRQLSTFKFRPHGNYYKAHGEACARQFRQWAGLSQNDLSPDIYRLLREMGFRLFRRALKSPNISALYIRHPEAGNCVLVNFREDFYRQRFSAAHECGHCLLDNTRQFNVTRDEDENAESQKSDMTKRNWSEKQLIEIRANSFATNFLMPPEVLRSISAKSNLSDLSTIENLAERLKVTVPALLKALADARLVSEADRLRMRASRSRNAQREDPELPQDLTDRQFGRRLDLLSKGLPPHYVQICFDAYEEKLISRGKLSECLLVDTVELIEVASLFGRELRYE